MNDNKDVVVVYDTYVSHEWNVVRATITRDECNRQTKMLLGHLLLKSVCQIPTPLLPCLVNKLNRFRCADDS